jgi:putative membrane protein
MGGFFFPHLLWAGFSTLFWLGLLGLVIWLAVRALRRPRAVYGEPWRPYGTPQAPQAGPSAIEILRERYARGEIDAVTFQQMLERLLASGAAEPGAGDGPSMGGGTPL